MEPNTVAGILKTLSMWAGERRTIDPQTYMEAASKLNSLLQAEVEKMIDMRSMLAKVRAAYLSEGQTAAFAKAQMEAMDEWVAYEKQKALIDTAKEQILLAKKNASLSSELMRNALN